MVEIRYRGFLASICRQFDTRKQAVQWLRQIGRADLIDYIEEVEICEHCDQKATNFIWNGAFCDSCLEGLAEDYYAFSKRDGPNGRINL